MGTILARKRSNGSTAYMGKIVLKSDGKIIHKESKTFDRRAAAVAWLAKRETELREKGPDKPKSNKTLAQAIEQYVNTSRKQIGRTKAQVLEAINRHEIAAMPCDKIKSQELVTLAQDLSADKLPQTVGNYLSHLAAVFAIAGPAWGYALDPEAMKSARAVMHRLGLTSRSTARERRPTMDELDRLMTFFQRRAAQSAPMHRIMAFALFSTRRQEEITRITWADLDVKHSRVMVRDMKNPGEKIGNNVWCDLPPEALRIIEAMPRTDARIFPYAADTISATFTRACPMAGVEGLRFHDLRHEGVSRLFEMGWNIPHVAAVSGHRSWTSLKRYTHIREAGDKYAGWKWLEVVTR